MSSFGSPRRGFPISHFLAGVTLAAGLAMPLAAEAGTLLVCRVMDLAAPLMSRLVVPAESLFRDNGRADDPLAAFGNDRWQLRLVTIADVVIQPLNECATVQVRVVSDSQVKAVTNADNRMFVYAGSYRMMDRPGETEELMSVRGRVLDQVQ